MNNSESTINRHGMPDESGSNIPNPDYTIILFYKYTPIDKPEAFVNWHKYHAARLGLTGRVHIAKEGINSTLEGKNSDIEAYIELLKTHQIFADLKDMPIKRSIGTGSAFPKLKAKVKTEIVSLKLIDGTGEDVDPNQITGIHLPPEELKKWYDSGEDFVVIDMRNDYEFKVGHFKNSINPGLKNFRDLPEIMEEIEKKLPDIKNKKVLTVCTGGVRCEKASGFLLKKGFKDVYQLDGGMHMYMEKFPGNVKEGKPCEFRGSLYTFDNRMTMDFASSSDAREIIGRCQVCTKPSERYGHCANDTCHLHLLICEECAKNHIYVWCSKECQDTGRVGIVHSKELGTEGALITLA